MTITVLDGRRSRVGEGPVWDPVSASVIWVDILGGHLHTTRPGTPSVTTTTTVDTFLGAVALRHKDGVVAAVTEGFAELQSGRLHVRTAVLPPEHRMNDGKADPWGRFVAGSTAMVPSAGGGALHILLPDWSSRVLLSGLGLPNGMAWSLDHSTFYLADSLHRTLRAFDVDPATGDLDNPRSLVDFSEISGVPDGLCVDIDGCLWVAMWGGGCVVRFDPSGRVIATITVPTRQPSSVAFGGHDLATLFVTTASEGLDETDSVAGSLLAVTGLGTRGVLSGYFSG